MAPGAPKVSVCLLAYNHARYIRQALDGVLMQRTDFPFEICIGEDESTDGTREICKEYAAKHPDKIRLFLRSRRDVIHIKGQPTGRFNFQETLKACHGEYVALLEGDDYWTSPAKLQRQADLLDGNPELSIATHPVESVDDEGRPHPWFRFGAAEKPVSSIEDLLERNFIPTCSAMFRRGLIKELPKWFATVRMGDWPLHLLNAMHGDIGCLPETMAAYRVHGSGMWMSLSERQRKMGELELLHALRPTLPRRLRPRIARRISQVRRRLVVLWWGECRLRLASARKQLTRR